MRVLVRGSLQRARRPQRVLSRIVEPTDRIDPAVVRRDFATAGLVLDGELDALRAANDDHSLSVFDAAVVGRTDRFVLRFRRP